MPSAASPRSQVSIAVVGDEAIDWFEIVVPPDQETSTDLPDNFRVTGGLRRAWLRGGASLLREMVAKAASEAVIASASYSINPQNTPLQSVVRLGTFRRRDRPGEGTVYRAEHLAGFVVEGNRAVDDPGDQIDSKAFALRSGQTPPEVATADIVLVDDSGNGFRQHEVDTNLAHAIENAALMLVRLSRPLSLSASELNPNGNRCLTRILETRGNRDTLVILNVDDLRREGVDISRRLSWERTAGDLASARLAALATGDPNKPPGLRLLGDLLRNADILVRIAAEGVVFLPRNAGDRPFLVFKPGAIESSRRDEAGLMIGLRTCFIAALAAALARSTEQGLRAKIERAIITGLEAADRLFDRGYIVQKSSKTGTDAKYSGGFLLRYPYDDIFGGSAPASTSEAGAFRTVPIKEARDWTLLVDRCTEGGTAALKPEKIVTDGAGELVGIPSAAYGKLLLVDIREIEAFRAIENLFQEYHYRNRSSITRDTRPLSVAVFGQPGSGKSFGIKEIASSVLGDAVAQTEINMSQLQDPDRLSDIFFSFRNDSLVGKTPLVLFDEFDAKLENDALGWLKYFLMPMQDGMFASRGRIHSVGRAIFVFIGGTTPSFDKFRGQAGDQFVQAKLPDFVSRLRGYVDVQGPNSSEVSSTDTTHHVRRAILLRNILERQKPHAPRMFTAERIQIAPPVVRAFLYCKTYEHGTRSMEAIVGMSQLAGRDRFDAAALPSAQQLRMHVDSSFDDILRRGE